MLRAEGVALRVDGRTLCADAAFDVAPGQLWCLLGRNGAGKTTLLRALAGLRRPDAGQVLLDGVDLARWNWQQLARARAYMAQRSADPFSASVVELVLSAAYAQREPRRWGAWFDSAAEESRAAAVLSETGLAPLARRDLLTLSGGERQRVALAAALMQDSRVLLLDEPLAHLDIDMQLAVLGTLGARVTRSERPIAIVMSLHDINLAARAATHVLLFAPGGRLVAGPAASVLTPENLTLAFGHGVRAVPDGERRWFVAE